MLLMELGKHPQSHDARTDEDPVERLAIYDSL